ncbi:MAG: hypothetical protein M1821_007083 [Bathelium mastoideum]|nr:MAG: hypothetical protein M1821_007083 [Bathelium mastoideum]
MLIIVMVHDLAGLLQQLLRKPITNQKDSAGDDPADPHHQRAAERPLDASSFGFQCIKFGEYAIESVEEKIGLIRTLASVQVNSLFALLKKLKNNASTWNRTEHQDMLVDVEKRFQGLRLALS